MRAAARSRSRFTYHRAFVAATCSRCALLQARLLALSFSIFARRYSRFRTLSLSPSRSRFFFHQARRYSSNFSRCLRRHRTVAAINGLGSCDNAPAGGRCAVHDLLCSFRSCLRRDEVESSDAKEAEGAVTCELCCFPQPAPFLWGGESLHKLVAVKVDVVIASNLFS